MTNSADPDQKPTDLDLHCLLRHDKSCSAREGLIVAIFIKFLHLYLKNDPPNRQLSCFFFFVVFFFSYFFFTTHLLK